MSKKLTYKSAGVNYDSMDAFKRKAQLMGKGTAGHLGRFRFYEAKMSRGESAYLIETPDFYLAHVEEGLGTKNLVADAVFLYAGRTYYDYIAQDTVAMIVNDMVTLGALPLSVAMHLAVGESSWFDFEQRSNDLIEGWRRACHMAGCASGGGETSTLKDMISRGTAVLSGSAVGIVQPKDLLFSPDNIKNGDQILFLTSSGIHANGLTLARTIMSALPQGYMTNVTDARRYGEMLLDPTHIYVPFIEKCIDNGVKIHYGVNITGHGWRKLMRARQPFVYVVERLPPSLPIFDFIQEHGNITDKEMYSNFNMGAGFALYIPEVEVEKMVETYQQNRLTYDFSLLHVGYIEKCKAKKVVIKPKGDLELKSLKIR